MTLVFASVLAHLPSVLSVIDKREDKMNTVDVLKPIHHVNYSYVFNFEEGFNHQAKRDWMMANWTQCFWYCGIYMILIWSGKLLMQSRPRFELRRALIMWNLFLATFSILGTMRTLPELLYTLSVHGFHHSMCNPSFVELSKVSGYWTWLFTLSKVPELGDTIFIVLRKQPLIFLHWYHHVTVLIYTWYAYTEHTAPGRWFICMNYMVHSCMYSYYALKAAKFRIPKWVSMFITTAQLTQMIVGCLINFWSYQVKMDGRECQVSYENIKISLLMYASYFVLFAHFFYNAYLAGGKKSDASIKRKGD